MMGGAGAGGVAMIGCDINDVDDDDDDEALVDADDELDIDGGKYATGVVIVDSDDCVAESDVGKPGDASNDVDCDDDDDDDKDAIDIGISGIDSNIGEGGVAMSG